MSKFQLRRFIHKNSILTNTNIPSSSPPPPSSSIVTNTLNNRINTHLRCTIFDENGNIEKFNSLISKNDLCKKYNLFPRDLRKLNTVTDYMGMLVIDKDNKNDPNNITSSNNTTTTNSSNGPNYLHLNNNHINRNHFNHSQLVVNHLDIDPSESGVNILLDAVRKRKSLKIEEINRKQNKAKKSNNKNSKQLALEVIKQKPMSLTASFMDNKNLTLSNLVSFENGSGKFEKDDLTQENENANNNNNTTTFKEQKKFINETKNLNEKDMDDRIQHQQEEALQILTNIKDSFITGGVLDSNTSATIPSFLIREDKILVTMLEFRCMIEKDSVVVFDSHYFREIRKYTSLLENMLRTEDYIINNSGHDANDTNYLLLTRSEIRRNLNKLNYLYSLHNEFRNEMSIKLKDSHMYSNYKQPYEFRALEAILNMVIKALNGELKYHVNKANKVLTSLEYNIDKVNLKELLLIDKRFNKFHQKAKLCCSLLEEILNDENNISDMYLHVPLKKRMKLKDNQLIDLEMLLENYHTQLDEIVQMCEKNVNSIKTTEEIINIILDSNRNQLMLLGLRFSTVLLSLGAGIFVASLYGMNLENFIEKSEDGFGLVIFIGSMTIFLVLATTLRKVVDVEKMNLTKLMRPSNCEKVKK